MTLMIVVLAAALLALMPFYCAGLDSPSRSRMDLRSNKDWLPRGTGKRGPKKRLDLAWQPISEEMNRCSADDLTEQRR